jgi:hypothetical protein
MNAFEAEYNSILEGVVFSKEVLEGAFKAVTFTGLNLREVARRLMARKRAGHPFNGDMLQLFAFAICRSACMSDNHLRNIQDGEKLKELKTHYGIVANLEGAPTGITLSRAMAAFPNIAVIVASKAKEFAIPLEWFSANVAGGVAIFPAPMRTGAFTSCIPRGAGHLVPMMWVYQSATSLKFNDFKGGKRQAKEKVLQDTFNAFKASLASSVLSEERKGDLMDKVGIEVDPDNLTEVYKAYVIVGEDLLARDMKVMFNAQDWVFEPLAA